MITLTTVYTVLDFDLTNQGDVLLFYGDSVSTRKLCHGGAVGSDVASTIKRSWVGMANG